ncbi:unnamed protein product [Ixodes persulcatus]
MQLSVAVELARVLGSADCRIETLDLSMCGLCNEAGFVLAEALARNRSVRDLDLSYNPLLDTRCLRAFVEALAANPTLDVMRVGYVDAFYEVAQLAIDRGQCGRIQLMVMTDGSIDLGKLAKFRRVSVDYIDFYCDRHLIGAAFDAYRSAGVLENLYLFAPSVGEVANQLGRFLSEIKSLETLNLMTCARELPANLETVLAGLARNRGLKVFKWTKCLISNGGTLCGLCNALRHNKTLTEATVTSTLRRGRCATELVASGGLSEQLLSVEMIYPKCGVGIFELQEMMRRNRHRLNRAVEFVSEPSVAETSPKRHDVRALEQLLETDAVADYLSHLHRQRRGEEEEEGSEIHPRKLFQIERRL